MLRGIYSAASGMQAQVLQQEVLADNLANTNTAGFKSARNTFRSFGDTIISRFSEADADSGTSIGEISSGANVFSTNFNFEQGSLKVTSNPMDIAVSGEGFIPIKGDGESIYFTRNGNFTMSRDGFLVTMQGRKVLDKGNSSIFLGRENINDFKVMNDGQIVVNGESKAQMKLFKFPTSAGIVKVEDGMFKPFDDNVILSEAPGIFQQGFLETSNVSPVKASTQMIEITRTYEANKKVIDVEVDTLQMLMDVGRI